MERPDPPDLLAMQAMLGEHAIVRSGAPNYVGESTMVVYFVYGPDRDEVDEADDRIQRALQADRDRGASAAQLGAG
jgi:hypothetical protein